MQARQLAAEVKITAAVSVDSETAEVGPYGK